jgi:hypothetical protein
MADIRVRLGTENAIRVPATSIVAGGKLYQLSDVDVSNGQVGGMILVFNSTTLKWEATSNPVLVGSLTVNGNTTLGQVSTNLNTFIGISSFSGKVNISGNITNTGGATFDNVRINSNIISSLPGTGDTLYIDPYPDGLSNQGTVVVKGNLQVDGTTTSINSTSVNADADILNLGDITSIRTVMSPVLTGSSTITLDSVVGINTGDLISGNANLPSSGITTINSYNPYTNVVFIQGNTSGSISTTSQLTIRHYYDTNTDKGISFEYNVGSGVQNYRKGFFGYKDSTRYLTYIPDATITGNVVSGTKGTLDIGSILLNFTTSGISTRGSAYFDSSGKLISTNSPEVGYASTSNYILTTDNSNVPVWTNAIDGGQY